MKLSLERKIVLGFGGALVFVTFIFLAAAGGVGLLKQTTRWVDHTHSVISRLEQLVGDLLVMQSASRGYMLTGSEDVLAPLHGASLEVDDHLKELRDLLKDNPPQRERLDQLSAAIASARTVMHTLIEDRRTRGAAVIDGPFSLEGQQSMDTVRNLVRLMVNSERRLLDERSARARASGSFSMLLIAIATVLAIGLGAIAVLRVTREIRHRRVTEQRLQESLDRIGNLYNEAPCGYHALDANGIFGEINDTELGWLGYTRDEVVGKMTFAELHTAESAMDFATLYARFKETGKTTNAEYVLRRKDGSLLTVLLNATAIYDSNGVYLASRATLFDITLRKRAEAERDRFFTLSGDLLCIASLAGHFKRVNPAWQRALGYDPDSLVDRPFAEFIHPDDLATTALEVARLSCGEESIDFENRYRHANGSWHWLRWSARASQPDGLIYASARDVTDERAADDRIRCLNTDLAQRAGQLEAANRELESFSYSVSHDLRAPLRHIDGFASLLTNRLGPEADKEALRYLGTISRAAKQMGMLIDDLLAFSRVGRTPLRIEHIRHGALLAEVMENGQYHRS
ncbi:MAG TPA: CHASE3 domain-containing protein, partial [Opitutaceae bacterium]